MALKSALRKSRYRVSVHGTLAEKRLPSFHTRVRSLQIARSSFGAARNSGARAGETTVFSYTLLPADRSPVHRTPAHGATVFSYTERGSTTGVPYTGVCAKLPKPLW